MPRDMDEVDPGIFQGGAIDKLPDGVQAVLNLQEEHEDIIPVGGRLEALAWMPIPDAPPFPGIDWLDAAVDVVAAFRAAKWYVLIHCMAGVSRSGMVDVAYHMKWRKWKRDEALAYVRTKRPKTNPNPAFMAGLSAYEDYLDSYWS